MAGRVRGNRWPGGWRAPLLLLVTLVLIAGCGSAGTGTPRDEGETEPASAAGSGGTVTETTAAEPPQTTPSGGETTRVEPEAAEVPFGAEPEASGGAGGEAESITGVRFGAHEGYERAVVDLGAGTVPEWRLESPEGDGLLRVSFPSVEATSVADGEFGGDLLEGFYVVRGPDGGMFVDFFAREAFVYRVIELSDPARLAVDFKPTGNPLELPLPARGGNTVLVQPRSGANVGDPFAVSGYSRNFEATNEVMLLDASGEVLTRQTVPGNDWSETWGYFETTLRRPPALAGGGTLRVGTYSARDGSFEGVEIPVE